MHHHHSIVISAFSVQNKYFHPSRHATALSSTKSKPKVANASMEEIRAAVYQPPIPSDKVVNSPIGILKQVADVLQMASRCSIDIVVFPEMFLSGGPNRILESEATVSTSSTALDRESYELNIVGNLCGELNVACVAGYAESMHESEMKSSKSIDESGVYNSIAVFHADGSRAGNYRCVSGYQYSYKTNENGVKFLKGHPLVEATTISIQLPSRAAPSTSGNDEELSTCREIKVGVMCGDDLLIPEHSRHLARNGAQILLALASFRSEQEGGDIFTTRVVEHIVPCRAMENRIPISFANYAGSTSMSSEGVEDEDKIEVKEAREHQGTFIGSSAFVSQNGSAFIRAPREEFGDLQCDGGYLLPCDVGALYAADINIEVERMISEQENEDDANTVAYNCHGSDTIQNSIGQWDLAPRINMESVDQHHRSHTSSGTNRKKQSAGFGREVQKIVGRQKQVSRKSKKRK